VGELTPQLYGDINFEWLLFYFLFLVFLVGKLAKRSLRSGGLFFLTTLFYSIVVLVSVSWAENYHYDLHTLMRIFARVLSPLLVLFMALNIFDVSSNALQYVKHIVFASVIISIMNIIQMVTGIGLHPGELRASANFLNPNGAAIFLVLTIPCQLYAIRKKVFSYKLGYIIPFIVIIGIFCTVSRKGIISMGVVYFLFFIFQKEFKKVFVVVALGVFISLGALSLDVVHHRFEKHEISEHYQGKRNMAVVGIQMFVDHPLIGLGYRGYYENFGKYVPLATQKKYEAHNIYVTVLSSYGLLGFIPFAGIFILPLFRSLTFFLKHNSPVKNLYFSDMSIICLLTLIPFMLCGMFAGGLFYNYWVLFVFYTNLSLFLSIPTNKMNVNKVDE
jgi:O-antigen ligase